ncbi:hypothetical protein K8I85_17880 [bacterium]|nr:hypothetical protein [bacterium]
MVLAVLEGLESVGDDGLANRRSTSMPLLEQQAVPAESFALPHDGRRGHAEFASDLTEAGAGNRAMEDGGEGVGSLQPVGSLEGLETEGDAAREAEVSLDSPGRERAGVESHLLESPTG